MFGAAYFGKSYFGASYWGPASGVVAILTEWTVRWRRRGRR